MSNIYIDIDSTYRNRQDYPNPADFVIIPKQDHVTGQMSMKNPCSNQIILYPPFGTPPLYFTTGNVEHRNLPYMYQTNDPHIVQLDELSISPTLIEDIDKTIVTDLYPRGSIPLGQANQFYTDDFIENMTTGETRQIESITYETGSDFVFQSSQVLWSTLIGDVFKIGVEPLSSITIPPSNIYNLYRGKYLKMITGSASGFRSLIVDYRQENESLSVFTLNSFSGVLPVQGDTFQIVSDRRWFVTLDTPFTNLSSYPGYDSPLPTTELRFTTNTIYESDQDIVRIDLNSNNDILVMERTSDVLGSYSVYKYILFNTLDTDNYFWDAPSQISTSILNSDSNYTSVPNDGNVSFQIQYFDTTDTWTVSAVHVLENGLSVYYGNIIATIYTGLDSFEGQIHSQTGIFDHFITYIRYDSVSRRYTLKMAWKPLNTWTGMVGVDIDTTSIPASVNETLTIQIHDMKFYTINNIHIYYSIVKTDSSTSLTEISYVYTRVTFGSQNAPSVPVIGTNVFIDINSVQTIPNIPSSLFEHYITRLHTFRTFNSGNYFILAPIIEYYNNTFYYTLMGSYDDGNFWVFLLSNTQHIHVYELGTNVIPSINPYTGIIPYLNSTKIYIFVWGNSGFVYNYFSTSDVLISPPPITTDITISETTNITRDFQITDVRVSRQNDNVFVVYTYKTVDGTFRVLSLNTQQFVVAEAVQYRIRKNPAKYIFDSIEYPNTQRILSLTTPIETIPISTHYKSVFYSNVLNEWFVHSNDSIYSSSSNWVANTLLNPLTNIIYSTFVETDTLVYLVMSNTTNTLFYTSSDGVSWTRISIGVMANVSIRDFITYMYSSLQYYLLTDGGSVYYSTDFSGWNLTLTPVTIRQVVFTGTKVIGLPDVGTDIYSMDANNLTTWYNHNILGIDIFTFRNMVWSSLKQELLITTDEVDILRTTNLIEWDIVYRSFTTQTNLQMEWSDYLAGYLGLSTVNSVKTLLFSTNTTDWNTYTLPIQWNDIDSFALNRESLLFGTIPTNTNVFTSMFRMDIWTTRIELPVMDTDLINSYLWVYNVPTENNTQYESYNDVYRLMEYDANTGEWILETPLRITYPFKVRFEILSDIEDIFNGLNIPFHYDQEKCYSIAIHDIILPNKVLQTYLGNQISFYPYIYIKISNEGAGSSSMYNMITNNPHATTLSFKIPVSQFTNDPSRLPYIQLSSGMVIKSKFNINMPFRFSVYLPNGDLFQMVEQDNLIPDFPNPLLQISATLRLTYP